MGDAWRVLVTGSRSWRDYSFLCGVLDGILAAHPVLTVIEGACPEGADVMAHAWVRRQLRQGASVRSERHPADWDAPCREECQPGHRRKRRNGREFCPAAGHYRNRDKLVAPGADECLAFLAACDEFRCRGRQPHGSHGGADCATLAWQAGIPVRPYARGWTPPATGFWSVLWPDRGAMETAL
jgi:hypothetical protein